MQLQDRVGHTPQCAGRAGRGVHRGGAASGPRSGASRTLYRAERAAGLRRHRPRARC
ncbi:MAG: hypothetical protein MZU97_09430 [Bacillus subtilis]|nr:hypothetical protein [Bacillus subtilis]